MFGNIILKKNFNRRMAKYWGPCLYLTTLVLMSNASPVLKEDLNDALADPVSINQWKGIAKVKGAYLISRVNLPQLESTCDELATTLKVSTKVMQVLIDSKLTGSSNEQVQRFSYILLKIENVYLDVVDYVESYSLCNNLNSIIGMNYEQFQDILDKVWIELTLWGNNGERPPFVARETLIETNSSYEETILRINNWLKSQERNSPLKLTKNNSTHNQIIRSLNQSRPPKTQSSPGLLIGFAVGVGAIGSTLLGSLFGNNNNEEIESINDNIRKIDRKLLLTNKRVDILAKNVSTAINDIKSILDRIVSVGRERDVYRGILWNLEQISENLINIKLSFRLSEIIITMLNSGIINSELVKVTTLQEIILEGVRVFPTLEFPLEVNHININEALKLIEIKRVGHNKFLMSIPLVQQDSYDIFRIVPHPVSIRAHTLLAEINEIILVTGENYIITNTKNIQTLNNITHVLRTIEPIWNTNKISCEWASFNKNLTLMLQLCNYKKVGTVNSTVMTELEDIRLIHFSETTSIELNCPNGKVRDKVKGMYKLPLYCDITTNQVHWPGRQVKEIDITSLIAEKPSFDITALPIININDTDEITTKIKELISDLPDEGSALTFSFKDISLDQVKRYSVIAYSSLSVIVFIHSIIIGLIIIAKLKKWWLNRNYYFRKRTLQRIRSKRDSFRGMRDSLRLKRKKLKKKARNFYNSSLSSSQRSKSSPAISLRSMGSSRIRKISDRIPSRASKFTNASTNTEPEAPKRSARIQKTKAVLHEPALRRYV